MSSVLLQEASTAATTTLELSNGSPNSPHSQPVCGEDTSYWQCSLEALAQKVIVGDTVVAKKKKQIPSSSQEEDQKDEKQQSSVGSPLTAAPVGAADCCPTEEETRNIDRENCDDGNVDSEAAADGQEHDYNLFRLSCCCRPCLSYRETIIQLFVEDFEYNTLWERLQLLIKKFYDFIPEQDDSQLFSRYMQLMDKSSIKWLTDGRINTKKNIQISLGSNLPLSNEMTFILVFSMLYTRDPHQLFELLCLQLRSIVRAYSQGLQDLITESSDGELQYNPTELLNYILDGYDKLCRSAKALSPLLFELQQGHLQQFSLTWCLINKRMYQRFVYLEVQKIIPECILKLKELLFDDEYKTMVYRFIQFDDEMNSTSQIWRDVWSLLHDYHKAKEDSARRKRISSAHSLLLAVKESEFNFGPEIQRQKERPIVEWLSLEDRNLVWQYVVHNLKTKWIACTNPRLNASIENIQCRKCNFALGTHYVTCDCRTCLIAGGTCLGISKEQLYCAKCSFFKKLDRDYLDYIGEFFNKPLSEKQFQERKQLNGMTTSSQSSSSSSSTTEIALPDASETELQVDLSAGAARKDGSVVATVSSVVGVIDNTSLYHISWAIFKHLPERVAYTWPTLEPKRFCIFQGEPCKINACRVAINIIAMLYPLNLSKFLIKSYHPLKEEERRKMAENWNIDVKNFMQRFCDDINKRWRTEVADRIHPLHFLDLLWESDDSESALLSDMASAFAEWFLIDFQFPQRNVIYQYFTKFFLAKGTDIEFDMKCFESVSGSRLFNWSTPASPLRQMIADDMQSKLLGVNWSTILPEEALAAINGDEFTSAAKIDGLATAGVLVASATTAVSSPCSTTMAAAVIEPIAKLCNEDGTICKDCKECFTDTVTKSEIFEKEIKKPLVEALKLAASNKILETELKTLQKEHSMLKDMVRDLEQIHEQKHSTVTQQCGNGNSSSSNSNGNSSSNNVKPNNTSKGSNTVGASDEGAVVSTASKNIVSNSGNASTLLTPSSSGTLVSKTTAASPVKTMLNQATNTPSKLATLQQHATGKAVPMATASKASASVNPATIVPTSMAAGKVITKATSTNASPGGTANSAMPATATPSTSTNSGSAATGAAAHGSNTHVIQSKEEHKKTCHRGGANGGEKGDGSCVCYYCTLFGQSVCLECNHNQRTNETRDRLRKKIKQLQSNKDNQQLKSLNLKNIKIPPGGLLKKINTNKSNSTNVVTNSSGISSAVPTITKESITSKVEALKNSNLKMAPISTGVAVAATSANVKIPMVSTPAGAAKAMTAVQSVSGKDTVCQPQKSQQQHPQQPQSQASSTAFAPMVKKPPPPPPLEEKSLDDILRFIEGDDDGDKHANNKKAAKKVKQKQKKQELKKITELGELSQKFSEFNLEEQKAQKRLQFQQNLKKKDKQQLLEDIQAYEAKKVQLQTDISSLVSSIKNNNPEFSFKLDGGAAQSAKDAPKGKSESSGKKSSAPPPTLESSQKQQLPAKLQQNINLLQQQKQRQQQQLLQQHQKAQLHQQQPQKQQQQQQLSQDNVSIDSTRRMVTIKRTFLPHAEPQVTVTAKGPSPDKDQLLYTFINGQLVPPEPMSSAGKGNAGQSISKKQQQQQSLQDQLKMKMAFDDAKQISDMIVKSQFTNDTDVWITEKLLKLSLKEQSQQQQVQSMREVDELMQKIQLQSVASASDKRKKEDIVSLTSKLSEKLTQIRSKAKSSVSEAQAKAAAQMLQKIVQKLELESNSSGGDDGRKKKKKKKQDKVSDEIDEIDKIVAWLDGLEVSGEPKKADKKPAEKALGKILNRKLSKDSISSSGSAQKMKDAKEQKNKDKNKIEEPTKKVKEAQKKHLSRKKSEVYIDPEFDNNTFKLLNLEDTESGEDEDVTQGVSQVAPDAVKQPKASSRPPTPLSPKLEPQMRPPTPPAPVPAVVSNRKTTTKKKNEKPKEHPTPPVISAKEVKQIKNKENLAPPTTTTTQKNSKSAHNVANTQTTNTKKPISAVAQPPDKAFQDNPNISKRQKKLLQKQQEQGKNAVQPKQKKQSQQQQQQQSGSGAARHIDKAIKTAERMVKSSNDRRSKVNIGADTTLELLNGSSSPSVLPRNGTLPKIPNTFPPGDTSFGASIMDQLSRGIRVEGLQLPPGITLTRVDAAQAEAIKAKRESIKKICEPMKPVQPEPSTTVPSQLLMGSAGAAPGMFMVNPMVVQPGPGQDAVIMVDTNKLKGSSTGESEKKPSKRNKRKNKNKNKHDSLKDGHSKGDGHKNQKGNNFVTLRNPMFQGPPSRAPASHEQTGARSSHNYEQPATIFKNDNGMFTIRNPALHQALAGSTPPSTTGFRPFNTNYLVENGIYPPQIASGTTNATTANYLQQQQQQQQQHAANLLADGPSGVNPGSFSAAVEPPRKCSSVIGSEMKNAQKQKQQQQHHPHVHHNSWQQLNGAVGGCQSAGAELYNPLSLAGPNPNQRCYSPFESLQYGLTGSQDYMNPQSPSSGYFPLSSPSTMSAIGSERSQARAHAAAVMSSTANPSCRRLFSSASGPTIGAHCCEDPPGGVYYDGLGSGCSAVNHKYDDLSFLHNLQPGQRLNSEVTIHNINESKFLRQQGQNLSNDIEITRIPAPGSSVASSGFSHPSHSAPHPLLMSPAGSTISSEAATAASVSSITGGSSGGIGGTSNSAASAAQAANLLALNDIETSLFLQKYQQQQLQLQQQLQQQMQQLQLQPLSRQQQQQLIGEYGENIFAPNQMVNLNELESEERDIESFKRFNYYFDPPKNKPKINLNVKDIVVNSKKPGDVTSNNHVGGSSGNSSSSSSSISNDNNPGGVSIGEDIQPIRPQAPIGTPSQKSYHQQQSTPVSSVGTGVSTMLYPATSDSPASSASIFDGISSSMSSHAHSCDDLYNDLLTSTGNLSLNLNLNLTQLQQSNSDPIVYDSFGVGGGAPSLSSVGSSSTSGGGGGKPPASELTQSIISN
ncbi:uncharacterized protein LOC131677496 [Topomyia yanbarensis]|uniref:uncharacterized protein LOC131677496 n=1 Tax=Topomyia yanbarensis TaxID=2498891 RepID=UPI00273AA2CB|nr:uncharacterized protein LOC131677496 [Topomyia yanbarensis]